MRHSASPTTTTLGSDNGSAFTARRFRAKLAELGIRHRRGGYRDPESQAFIESWQRSLADGSVVFEFAGKVDGRVLRRRLAAANKTDAAMEARGLTTDRDRGILHARADAPTITALRDEWLTHLRSLVGSLDERQRRSPRCVALYEHHVGKRFEPEFG